MTIIVSINKGKSSPPQPLHTKRSIWKRSLTGFKVKHGQYNLKAWPDNATDYLGYLFIRLFVLIILFVFFVFPSKQISIWFIFQQSDSTVSRFLSQLFFRR